MTGSNCAQLTLSIQPRATELFGVEHLSSGGCEMEFMHRVITPPREAVCPGCSACLPRCSVSSLKWSIMLLDKRVYSGPEGSTPQRCSTDPVLFPGELVARCIPLGRSPYPLIDAIWRQTPRSAARRTELCHVLIPCELLWLTLMIYQTWLQSAALYIPVWLLLLHWPDPSHLFVSDRTRQAGINAYTHSKRSKSHCRNAGLGGESFVYRYCCWTPNVTICCCSLPLIRCHLVDNLKTCQSSFSLIQLLQCSWSIYTALICLSLLLWLL